MAALKNDDRQAGFDKRSNQLTRFCLGSLRSPTTVLQMEREQFGEFTRRIEFTVLEPIAEERSGARRVAC
jgi:hypothetical protein